MGAGVRGHFSPIYRASEGAFPAFLLIVTACGSLTCGCVARSAHWSNLFFFLVQGIESLGHICVIQHS